MYRLIWVPIIIGWVFVGFLLFIPYAWLVGGVYNTTLSAIMPFVAPAVILVLVFLIFTARNPWIDREAKRGFLTAFWILLTVANLPIVLRFASIGLRSLDYNTTADFVFKCRFWSIPVAILLIIAVFMIISYKALEKYSKKPEPQ